MSRDLHLLFSSQRDDYLLYTIFTKACCSGPPLLVMLSHNAVLGCFGSWDWSGAEYKEPALRAAAAAAAPRAALRLSKIVRKTQKNSEMS